MGRAAALGLAAMGLAGVAGLAAAAELVLVHTNDMHGFALPRRYTGEQMELAEQGRPVGGLLSVATLLRMLRHGRVDRESDVILYLDAGDWFSGALYDAETKGAAVARAMEDKALGMDATVPGNHAWDYGREAFFQFLSELTDRVPVLAANLTFHGKPLAATVPYKVFPVAGRKVAVLGLVTDGALHAALPKNTEGFAVEGVVESLKKWLPKIRAEADYVILLSHVGFAQKAEELAELDHLDEGHPEWNVDLVIDGHSHRSEALAVDGDTYLVQADHYGLRAGVVRVPIGRGGKFGKPRAELVRLDSEAYPPDRGMALRLKEDLEARAKVEDRIVVAAEDGAHAPHLLRTDPALVSPMGDLMGTAMLRAAAAEGAPCDLALAYHRGVRTGLYSVGGGYSAGNLHAVMPFADAAVRVTVPGKVLEPILVRGIQQRNRMSFGGGELVAREAKDGSRKLVSARIGGAEFDPARTYTLVCDEFLAGWFKGAGVEKKTLKTNPRDALLALLRAEAAQGPLTRARLAALAPPSARLEKGR